MLRLLERLPLATRLMAGFAAMVLMMLLTGAYSLYNFYTVNQNVQRLYHHDLQAVFYAKDAMACVAQVGRAMRRSIMATDDAGQEHARQQLSEAQARLGASIAQLRERLQREDERLLLARFDASYAAYQRNVLHAMQLLQDGALADVHAFLSQTTVHEAAVAAESSLEAITNLKEDNAQAGALHSEQLVERSTRITLALLLASVAWGVLLSWIIARSIRLPASRLIQHLQGLTAGRLRDEVPHADYPNELGELARAVAVLQAKAREHEDERWVKTHLAMLSARMQAASTPEHLARQFLEDMAPLLGLGQGALFLLDESGQRLCLLQGYAFQASADLQMQVALGEGLVGQCAAERAPIVWLSPPAGYVRIVSGLGEGEPRTIIALPVVLNSQLLGVLELATLEPLGGPGRTLLDGAMPVLAMSLEILERSDKTRQLLDETTRQAQSLERQAAQLEEQTVELEAQQAEIRATEAWYRGIIESAPDGMLVADENGHIVMVNPKLEQMFGYQPGELSGQLIEVLVPQAARSQHPAQRSGFMQTGGSRPMAIQNGNLSGRRKDGSEFFVDVGLSRLPALGGHGVCVCASVRDVTERRRMEERIRQTLAQVERAKKLNQAILDNSPAVTYLKAPDGRYLFVNRAWCELFGYEPAQVVGRTAHELFAAKLADAYTTTDMAVLEHGEVQHSEDTAEVGGTTRTYASVRIPLRDEQGELYAVCVISSDMTERLASERAVAESAQQLGFALRGGHLGLWDWDIPTGRSRVNAIWAEMLGYRLDEVSIDGNAAASWERLLHPDDSAEANARFAHCIEDPAKQDFEALFRMQAKDGGWRWIRSQGQAIERDADGRARRVVGIHQDVTEHQHLQDEMRRAKEVAEEATRAKSDFLANMSHEIRTPMNAIIGMSHLALQTELDQRQRNYIGKVHRAAENLLGIINDILDFSKIEAGKMGMESIDFRLEDVIEHLSNLVGMKAEDKGVELLLSVAADVPMALVGDPLRLGQVLINLGNNAVKFTEAGEVVIGVEVAAQNGPQVELHFWVRDTGIGMTPEQCGRMFQSFAQADSTTTRKYGGTGLGLTISKRLVELMQGRIWVQSTPGQGSVFHFHAVFGVQAVAAPRRSHDTKAFVGVRTLVVDDNASAREILTGMAQDFGMQAQAVSNGQQALEQLLQAQAAGRPFELVLLDWRMPVLDGLATLEHLPGIGLSPLPTVIMVTSYAREEALQNAGSNGVRPQAILTKPVTADQLQAAMGEALGRSVAVENRSHQKADTRREHMDALRGRRVLLVEDNDMNQELALELLGQAGIEVVVANHGQQALDILAGDRRFDGILMDCQMPVMDGYTAARHIRADAALAHIPIVAMTANAMAGDREKVLAVGMVDHIAKPLDVSGMFATMAAWMTSSPIAPMVQPAPSGDAARPDAAALPPLPGIDIQRGLATAMDNLALYRRLLLKFRDGQGGFEALFEAARQSADREAATRAAHTLKGTAGNIGALAVQTAAAALEAACHAGQDAAIPAALQQVREALAPVMQGLAALDAEGQPTAAAPNGQPPMDAAWLRPGLERVAALLQACDSEASDVMDELLARARSTSDSALQQRLAPVARAVADFDFDKALELIQQWGGDDGSAGA